MYTKAFATKSGAEQFANTLKEQGKYPRIEKTTQFIVIWETL